MKADPFAQQPFLATCFIERTLMEQSGDLMALMVALTGASHTPVVITDLLAQNLRTRGVLRVLQAIRKYLGMNVAFVSRFRDHDRIMEHVDTDGPSPIHVGLVIPLDEGYCLKVTRGELPELIPDTTKLPAVMSIPETRSLPIGSHLSVPIRLSDGEVYGSLCCFSHEADPSLGERDLQMLHAFAEVLGAQIEESTASAQASAMKVNAVRKMIEKAPQIVYQPIYSLRHGALLGMECLSRFDGENPFTPSHWFALAEEVGLRQELEVSAIQKALRTLDSFPPPTFFALNSSPQIILNGALANVLKGVNLKRIVIEITEHAMVEDYAPLAAALKPLRQQGLRIAIDDAGAGYASMRHIVNLQPDFIKLDSSLTASIDQDSARRALARALASFAKEIGSRIVAEGIETRAELSLLQSLGIETGQGFLLQEPVPMDVACRPELSLCRIRAMSQQLPV